MKKIGDITSKSEIKKLAFLYEASNVLFSSLEYEKTFKNIALLCVPELADYCLIDIKTKEGKIRRVTAVHADPGKAALTMKLQDYPPSEKRPGGPAHVFKTGKMEVIPTMSEKWLASLSASKEHFKILKELNPKSGIYVPLKVRGKTAGVLSLISTNTPRTYASEDLSLLEGLAMRISMTLHNAQLYQEAQEEIQRRQEVEEELTKSKEQLEIFFQNVADGISVQDTTGTLIYANDAAARAVGFNTADEMLKNPSEEFMKDFMMMDEHDNPFPYERLPGRRALLGEKNPKEIIKFLIRSTGEIKYSSVKATPIFDKKKKVKYAVNVFHDITERKEEERRVNQFIGFAGHELKSPLASIKAFVQLLKKRSEKQQDITAIDYLTKVDLKINVLTKLINDYLDITKIRAGKFEYFDEIVSFDELLHDVVDDIQQTSPHKIIVENGSEAHVIADKNRIVQVLGNLIQNAVKYSPGAEKIVITNKVSDKYVECSVKDYGIGIAQDKLNKLFQPYYRATDPSKGKFPGLGLGLYLSSEIIKHYGGKVRVESIEGKGSTFTLQLPVWKEKR